MQNESKTFHMTSTTNTVNTVHNTAKPVTSFRTTTPSTATTGRTTTKQVNPVHPGTSHKAPLGYHHSLAITIHQITQSRRN